MISHCQPLPVARTKLVARLAKIASNACVNTSIQTYASLGRAAHGSADKTLVEKTPLDWTKTFLSLYNPEQHYQSLILAETKPKSIFKCSSSQRCPLVFLFITGILTSSFAEGRREKYSVIAFTKQMA
jgi:hypothetical protein